MTLLSRYKGNVLDSDELKRRMDAARTLRGLTQVELAELVHADGLGKHDVGRLERGAIPLSRALKDSMSRHLGVPPEWFTDADFSRVLDTPGTQLDRIEQRLAEAESDREGMRQLIAQQNQLLARQSEILARIEELVGVLREAEIIELPTEPAATFPVPDQEVPGLDEAQRRLTPGGQPRRETPARKGSRGRSPGRHSA